MKRPAILIGMSMVCWALIIGTVLAADEAAQKRREKWLERQQELNKHGILKLETVISTGDPSNRLDVVILGDGFYKNTMDRFQAASDRLAKGFLGLMPYDNFANYINVHRLYLESPKGDFSLDSEVTGEGLMRILNCDRAKAESLAELAPDCDLVVVLCNTVRSGRANATGKIVLLWGKSGSSVLTIHEFGHAFAGLADEYEEADPERRHLFTAPEQEPGQANATIEPEPLLCKWHYWAEPPPPRHKITNSEGAIGVSKGVYRPERSCAMRNYTTSFCAVCMEQMIRTFFKYISPIDDQTPNRCIVAACQGEKPEFGVRALDYQDTSTKTRIRLDWRWYLDGKLVDPKDTARNDLSMYAFNADAAGPGVHDIVASMDVNDQRVRRDQGLLSDARFWRVEVLGYPRPKLTAPERKDARPGEKIAFTVKLENTEPVTVKAEGLPNGATFDGKTGAFEWATAEADAGAYLVEFVAANDKLEERAQTVIAVRKTSSKPPKLVGVQDEEGFEGQPFDFTLAAEDPDTTNLLFNVVFKEPGKKDVPPPDGFRIDRRTGKVTWTPGFTQAASYKATAEVTDGVNTATSNIMINVASSPIPTDVARKLLTIDRTSNFDFCQLFRARDSYTRAAACGYLKDMPRTYRAMQLVRLLRDPDDGVKGEVLKQLQILMAGESKDDFLTVFFREMSGKIPQLTDFAEACTLTKKIIEESQVLKLDPALKNAMASAEDILKKVDAYNARRAYFRKKADAERQKEAEKEARKKK